MTRAEALQEARKRWGGKAEIDHQPKRTRKDRHGKIRHHPAYWRVGYQAFGMMFMIEGDSKVSWEDAFDKADKA